jgi:hypothetical protein
MIHDIEASTRKETHMPEKPKRLITASGAPVDDDLNTLTAGPLGPALM